jgi:hypothetical protein
LRKSLLISASLIVIVTFIVVATIFLRVWRIPFVQVQVFGISHSAVHWVGWIGTLYLAFATPFYPIVKRKYRQYTSKILNIHVLGNLLGILMVTIHFAHQVTRPPSSYPDLGTGIVLYATMIILLMTGFVLISGLRKLSKQSRFLHPAYAITFYTVIIMHILQDLLEGTIFT